MSFMDVRLNTFEGPLDLLLYLIEKNEMDIYDIQIKEITNQYMEYVNELKKSDLNNLSDFLVMAATLLDIKSRLLLPPRLRTSDEDDDADEEDLKDALIKQLIEYRKYKSLGSALKERQEQASLVLYRTSSMPEEILSYEEPIDPEELTKNVTMDQLKAVFERVMKRQANKIDPIRSKFGKIEKEEVSLEDKIKEIEMYAKDQDHFSFQSLLEAQPDKPEIVVTFLAMLELIKMGKVTIHQDGTCADILVESKGETSEAE